MDSAERVFILSMILVRRHFLSVVTILCAVELVDMRCNCGFDIRHKTFVSLCLGEESYRYHCVRRGIFLNIVVSLELDFMSKKRLLYLESKKIKKGN